jgi:hypothetical protein
MTPRTVAQRESQKTRAGRPCAPQPNSEAARRPERRTPRPGGRQTSLTTSRQENKHDPADNSWVGINDNVWSTRASLDRVGLDCVARFGWQIGFFLGSSQRGVLADAAWTL